MENTSQQPLENQEAALVASQPSQLNKILLFVVVILSLALVGFGGYFLGLKEGTKSGERMDNPQDLLPEDSEDAGVGCTMDAMECPDGSYVGRTGPDCEFECSTQDDDFGL